MLTYRFATTNDATAIVALVESAYRGESSRAGWTTEADLLDGQRTDSDAVRTILESAGARMLLAYDDDAALVGCCQLQQRPDAVAYFGMFAVRPARQGQGTGKHILARAEQLARQDWAARTMVMTVLAPRLDLIAWYERRGYRRTGATTPFPYGNLRAGQPKRPDLSFVELAKNLAG